MSTLSPESAAVLQALRENTESSGHVYLDNARPAGMSDKSFRSHLAALSKAGLYKPVDGWAWGEVKPTAAE